MVIDIDPCQPCVIVNGCELDRAGWAFGVGERDETGNRLSVAHHAVELVVGDTRHDRSLHRATVLGVVQAKVHGRGPLGKGVVFHDLDDMPRQEKIVKRAFSRLLAPPLKEIGQVNECRGFSAADMQEALRMYRT